MLCWATPAAPPNPVAIAVVAKLASVENLESDKPGIKRATIIIILPVKLPATARIIGVSDLINSVRIMFTLTNIKLLSILIAYFVSIFIVKNIGKRLERITRKDLVNLWLSEIGSDVRLYGFASCTVIALGLISNLYFKGLSHSLLIGLKIIISLWVFVGAIALIEVSEKYLKKTIFDSNISEIDKRNYLTLIPVAASIFKIFSYCFIVLSILSSVGVDIAPIINIGAIGIGALMFAGSETIKDVLATLKFFLSRKLYVGSYVKVNNLKVGYVIRITIIDTWIESEFDSGVKFTQIIGNGSIQTILILTPPPQVIREE